MPLNTLYCISDVYGFVLYRLYPRIVHVTVKVLSFSSAVRRLLGSCSIFHNLWFENSYVSFLLSSLLLIGIKPALIVL